MAPEVPTVDAAWCGIGGLEVVRHPEPLTMSRLCAHCNPETHLAQFRAIKRGERVDNQSRHDELNWAKIGREGSVSRINVKCG